MKPELAEQLLYESEATLRLVDSLLDELQGMDEHLQDGLGMRALLLAPEAELEGDDLAMQAVTAASGEARTLLGSLSRSRDVLDRAALETEARWAQSGRTVPSAGELRAGLESALALVERLAELPGERGPSLPQQIREQLLALLDGARVQESTEQRLSYATSVLRDTELQVGALVERLS